MKESPTTSKLILGIINLYWPFRLIKLSGILLNSGLGCWVGWGGADGVKTGYTGADTGVTVDGAVPLATAS